MKHRKGFTLTELVVLIAAGALVGGLLLASLGDAKEKVQSAACLSNLREISLAIRLYTDDHNGFMPTASYGAGIVTNTWPKILGLYLPLRGATLPHKVFTCPSAGGTNWNNIANQNLNLTYSCTGAMLGFVPTGGSSLTASRPRRQDQVLTPPAQTPLIIEGQVDPAGIPTATSCRSNTPWQPPFASYDLSGSEPPGPGHYLDFRHSDAMNIAFFDGSVRNVTFAQAKATFTKSLWEGR